MKKLRLSGYTPGFFFAVGLAVIISGDANAISNTYFPNGDAGGSRIDVAIGKTNHVQDTSARLKAYFTSSSGQIQFERYNYCPSGDDQGPDSSKKTKFTIVASTGQVRVGDSGSWESTKTQRGDYVTSSRDCNATLTFNLRNLAKDDAGSGRYVALINVDRDASGYMNYFNIKTPTSGGLISHASGSSGYEVTVDQTTTHPTNTDYKIKFGSDCRVTEKIRKSISLYDLDGPGGNGAQVGRISMKLQAKHKNQGNGAWRYINIANQRSRTDSRDPHPGVNHNRGSETISPLNRSNAAQLVWFTAEPNYQYRFELNNIYYNNTIQFGTPFDGIFYNTGCQKWDTTPNSYVKRCDRERWGRAGRTITVSRPTDVCFKHSLKNDGPGIAKTKARVQKNWNASKQVGDPNTYSNIDGWNRFDSLGEDAVGNSPDYSLNFPTSVTTAPDGTKYCQRYFVDPKKKTRDGTTGTSKSTPACAIIGNSPDDEPEPSQFSLKPKINIDKRTYAYYPNIAAVGAIETESGTVSGNHDWEVYAIRYSSAPATSSLTGDSSADVCSKIPAANRTTSDCASARIYSGTYPAVGQNNPELIYNSGGPDAVGTNICFFTRVKDPTHVDADNNSWRYSNMECTVAGVNPKIQVWGGDVKASEAIQTTFNDIASSNRRFGSWGEYNVFSGSKNYAMSSGAGLGSPSATVGSPQSLWSSLTFANTSPSGYGYFSAAELATPPASQSGAIVRNADLTATSIDHLVSQMMPGRTLGSLVANRDARQTFVINGRLTINGNLTYPATVSSIRHLPRITVIARDGVVVGEGVTRIDIGIETSKLSTCSWVRDLTNYFVPLNHGSLLRSGVCGVQLRFNSPVSANKLYLYRTYDDTSGGAAETFNLRADSILSSYVGGGVDSPVATTNSVTELPPRF